MKQSTGFLLIVLSLLTSISALAQQQTPRPPPINIDSIDWSPDGTKIAIARGASSCTGDDNAVHIIDVQTNLHIGSLTEDQCNVLSVAWSPDGTRIATTSMEGYVRIFNALTYQLLSTSEPFLQGRRTVIWNFDSSRLLVVFPDDPAMEILDGTTAKSVSIICCHSYGIFSADWSPTGAQFASGGVINTIEVWDAASGQSFRSINAHPGEVRAIAYSPDGTLLASGGNSPDSTVRIWDPSSGALVHILNGHTASIRSLAWHPQGTYLASASLDGTVRLWNVVSGEQIDLLGPFNDLNTVAWSPDGTRLAFGGDAETGEAKVQIVSVSSITFPPVP
ncbi:MAG: WD40 repeat domain-containing protein [bacterium]|nr:WD40 repeat domain-containing protein [bacterium]